MSQADYVIGLDLGGTKLAASLFRVEGERVVFQHALKPLSYEEMLDEKDKGSLTAEGRSRQIGTKMAESVRELMKTAGGGRGAVGVASAGFVEEGIIVDGHNTGMKNYPLQKNLEEDTGLPSILYKDSWAPVFALGPGAPSIVFSIGTGFGGVSAEGNMHIRLRSYSASKKIIWVPYLYYNDDPGYAASFSVEDMAGIIRRAHERFDWEYPGKVPMAEGRAEEVAQLIRKAAMGEEKVSPSLIELLVARGLAWKAASRMKPKEVFADFPCASPFPAFMYEFVTGRAVTPKEMDGLATAGDATALCCFRVQAEFIGWVLFKMQEERRTYGLPFAERVCGTGSGYNATTRALLGRSIIDAMHGYAEAEGMKLPVVTEAELLEYKEGSTTLACYGAAVGAALGMRV